jgi:hypothetical protein
MIQAKLPAANVYRTTGGASQEGTNGVAVTNTGTTYSDITDVSSILNPSYHLEWSGTPTGTFTVWGSNKENPIAANDNDWFNPPLAVAISQPAGSASKDFVDLSGWPFRKMRLKYVASAGAGVINAFVAGKP